MAPLFPPPLRLCVLLACCMFLLLVVYFKKKFLYLHFKSHRAHSVALTFSRSGCVREETELPSCSLPLRCKDACPSLPVVWRAPYEAQSKTNPAIESTPIHLCLLADTSYWFYENRQQSWNTVCQEKRITEESADWVCKWTCNLQRHPVTIKSAEQISFLLKICATQKPNKHIYYIYIIFSQPHQPPISRNGSYLIHIHNKGE